MIKFFVLTSLWLTDVGWPCKGPDDKAWVANNDKQFFIKIDFLSVLLYVVKQRVTDANEGHFFLHKNRTRQTLSCIQIYHVPVYCACHEEHRWTATVCLPLIKWQLFSFAAFRSHWSRTSMQQRKDREKNVGFQNRYNCSLAQSHSNNMTASR